MGKFLEAEKLRQTAFKTTSTDFSAAAKADGVYKKMPRQFCLPVENADENLHTSIRSAASQYFQQHCIGWHDGGQGLPSNHLCDSQVCCVNFLFPFAGSPDALRDLLLPLFPDIHKMLPLDQQFVAFEWIGDRDYLGENRSKRERTRGANATSADAAVFFERKDGARHFVLIEWKYTESYNGIPIQFSKHGTDRSQTYHTFFASDDCPIDKTVLPAYTDLFYEPFYQFMRQQLLAREMEKACELGADIVSVLHIAPASNRDFEKVTSPALRDIDTTAVKVWKRLTQASNRFTSVRTETLFGAFRADRYPELGDWWEYIHQRYAWLNNE